MSSDLPSQPAQPPVPPLMPQPVPSRTPPLGIAAFVLSILGFCGITAIVGIVLGIIGRGQAKRAGAGTGLPTAAIAIGAAWLALLVVGVIVGAVAGSGTTSSSPDAAQSSSAPAVSESAAAVPPASAAASQGPDYLAVLPSSELTNAETCPAYQAVFDEYTAKADKLLANAAKVPDDPYKASSYRDKYAWVTSDFQAAYSAAFATAAMASLDAVSGGKAAQVPSIETYLTDSLAACNLSQAVSELDDKAAEVNALASSINEAADSRPWYPKGYEEWVDGVAFKYNASATNNNSLFGWAYNVISRDGCPNGLYVEVNFTDGGTIVDYGNDLLASLPANRKALVQLRSGVYSNGVDDFEVSEVSCY